MKTYKGESIKVYTFKRGGYFVLRIERFKTFLAATRTRGVTAVDSCWMPAYEVKFDYYEYEKAVRKANSYFKKIKESHPDMVMVADEPEKYFTQDGKIEIYPWCK